MNPRTKWRSVVAAVLFVSSSVGSVGSAGSTGDGKTVLVRFAAFSMGADERIMGVRLTVRQGSIASAFKPRNWDCEGSGFPGVNDTMYCFSPNREYAIFASTMLPEFTVSDQSGDNPGRFLLEAAVVIERNDGARREMTIRHSELRISR